MDSFLHAFVDLRDVKFHVDDDLADRLNRKYTAGLLFLFSILVSARQYFGESVHCWWPENVSGNHEHYANLLCWVQNNYFVNFKRPLPEQGDWKREDRILYYQWMPVIFVMQAIMFLLPWAIWKMMHKRSGINIGVIMEAASQSNRANIPEVREKSLRYAVFLVDRFLKAHRLERFNIVARLKERVTAGCVCCGAGRFSGVYLTLSYMLSKSLYLTNSLGQLFFMDLLLGYKYHLYGYYLIRYFLYREQMQVSEFFPQVTLCDFEIRQLANVQTYTVQCVLPINIFNEKIFAVMWFWLIFLTLVNGLSLIGWLARLCYWPGQFLFVKRQLQALDVDERGMAQVKKFAMSYLRKDGLFVLRMIAKNAGDLVATELLCGLWENYGATKPTGRPPRLSRSMSRDPPESQSKTNGMKIVPEEV